MAERIALYPGSFDPPTFGHLDLIERAAKVFDRVIVAVARNDEKSCLFSVDDRVDMLETVTKSMDRVSIAAFTGLTADYARECGATALVRGLRVVSDFEFELTMAITNQKLNHEVDTVILMPSEKFLFISSRLVKEIAHFGGDVSEFVPAEVAQVLRDRFSK
ncbi:MAG: pantetheine-phosphate adenylyltransferase [bacterium]|nr:pantetheine-phosphate adenylyltransferase [bacterium]